MVFNKINKIFLLFALLLATVPYWKAAALRDFVIVLDPGHGGKDAGASGPYGYEKNVTLEVALKLGSLLQERPNIKVQYTRTTDIFIELATRAQIANNAHADLFISIHCNSAHSGASGTETWVLGTETNREMDNLSVVKRENSVIYLEDDYEKTYDGFDPNSPEDLISMTLLQGAHYDSSVYIAGLIEKEFVNDHRKSRGVKQSGFAVLWRTAMPSVLVETGFISNPTEGKYLCSAHGQDEIAHSIANAFDKYKQLWDLKNKEVTAPVVEKLKEKPLENGFYKIQILASNNHYKEGSPQMRGLKNVLVLKDGNLYKYYYGDTSLQSEMETLKSQVQKIGFDNAYEVLFLDKNTYKIEIFSSKKRYHPNSSTFDGIPNVVRVKNSQGPKYSYHTQESFKYAEGLEQLKAIRSKGFENAHMIKNSD